MKELTHSSLTVFVEARCESGCRLRGTCKEMSTISDGQLWLHLQDKLHGWQDDRKWEKRLGPGPRFSQELSRSTAA